MSAPPPVPLIAEAEQWLAHCERAVAEHDDLGAESRRWIGLTVADARALASLLQHLLTYCRAAAARI